MKSHIYNLLYVHASNVGKSLCAMQTYKMIVFSKISHETFEKLGKQCSPLSVSSSNRKLHVLLQSVSKMELACL